MNILKPQYRFKNQSIPSPDKARLCPVPITASPPTEGARTPTFRTLPALLSNFTPLWSSLLNPAVCFCLLLCAVLCFASVT